MLYDDRECSRTCGATPELFVDDGNYVLMRISPKVWDGVKGLGQVPAIMANASHPDDPREISRLEPFSPEIAYDWSLRQG